MFTLSRVRTPLAIAILLVVAVTASAQHVQRPQMPPGQRTNAVPHASLVGGITTQNLSATLSPAQLATTILGSGVVIQNVTFSGTSLAAGTFQGGTGIIGFESGIVLSSGNMNSVAGPNLLDDTTTQNLTGSDPDLAALIPGYVVHDACTLEFDFSCPTTQMITFQFVFSSEEYNEWVNTAFNDVFGFFLNGQNIAIVPGTTNLPVSINNVNCNNPYAPPGGSHCSQFINNDLNDGGGAVNTEMDGLTLLFTATAPVSPGVNHIKLAIGDAGDDILDSNVFIRAGSLTCGPGGPTPPVCELPMPALELGAGPQHVSDGTVYSHSIRAIAANGLAGQQVTVTSVTVTKDGVTFAMPSGSSIAPALPITGQPALSTFTWTPVASQNGTWDFTYHLVDQLGTTGAGTVEIIVGPAGNDDVDCFLIGSGAQGYIDLGNGDAILIALTNWNWFAITPTDIPDFDIPDDPMLAGIQFFLQVGLYQPLLFPADPIKTSNGLHVTINNSAIQSYGSASGILLWSTTPPLIDSNFRIDFTIL